MGGKKAAEREGGGEICTSPRHSGEEHGWQNTKNIWPEPVPAKPGGQTKDEIQEFLVAQGFGQPQNSGISSLSKICHLLGIPEKNMDGKILKIFGRNRSPPSQAAKPKMKSKNSWLPKALGNHKILGFRPYKKYASLPQKRQPFQCRENLTSPNVENQCKTNG